MLLKKSDYNTEGTYECEVSTSTFSTVIAAKDLKIYGKLLPKLLVVWRIDGLRLVQLNSTELHCRSNRNDRETTDNLECFRLIYVLPLFRTFSDSQTELVNCSLSNAQSGLANDLG